MATPTSSDRIPYVDCHTHRLPTPNEAETPTRALYSLPLLGDAPRNGYFSAAIHPWNTDHCGPREQEWLRATLRSERALALGECGLDRLRGAPLPDQIQCLTWQLRLAKELAKPLIIHCVRAWAELLPLLRTHASGIPWIAHSFRGSPHLANQLVEAGAYISPAPNRYAQLHNSLTAIPPNRLLLETDDSPHHIRHIYALASQLLGMADADLRATLWANFTRFLGREGPL